MIIKKGREIKLKEFFSKINKKQVLKWVIFAFAIYLYSFLFIGVGELAAHHRFAEIFTFLFNDNVFLSVANTALLAAALITLITFITTKLSIGVGVVSVVSYIFYVADGMKIHFRSEPLYTWDLTLIGETANILNSVGIKMTYAMIFGFLFIIAAIGLAVFIDIKFMKHYKMKYVFNLIPAGISIVIFFTSWFTLFSSSYMATHGLHTINWDQLNCYKKNGLVYSMLSNHILSSIKEPENYNEQAIKNIISATNIREDENIQPNIIIFMSEAYSDIEDSTNVTFSKDIDENFDRLAETYLSGRCMTKQFGGGTANSEFEVLTGLSSSLLPPGTIAYTSYTKNDTPSIVSYLKNLGYYTTATHPYRRSFFSRGTAYEKLGFDVFYSEEHFENPERKRGEQYVTDQALVDKIISLYEENKSSGKPFFNHSVSMQNHSSYWANEFHGEDRVTFETNAQLTDVEANALQTYASGMYLSDKALGKLVEYFEKVEEPTVILYFGDHQPYLCEGTADLMQKIGYLPEDPLENDYKFYSTPYLIWNNFEEEPTKAKEDMSMFQLLPYMTDILNMKRPDYYYFMNDFYEICRGFTDKLYLDSEGKVSYECDSKATEMIEKFKLLQYDILHGKKYCIDKFYSK